MIESPSEWNVCTLMAPATPRAEALFDALREFVASVAREGEQQQVLRPPVAAFDDPAGLRYHDRRLAAARGRYHQIVVVVDTHGPGAALP